MLNYNIGLVGPSRIGKSTLMISILDSVNELFKTTKFVFESCEDGTKTALNLKKAELIGSINAKSFNAGSLVGDANDRTYKFILKNGDSEVLQLSFLDYPGGWIRDNLKKYNEICKPHIRDSRVLLIPIDATLIMEAYIPEHRISIPNHLQIPDIQEIVSDWIKMQKVINKNCSLVFAPVKCESYLKDIAKEDELKQNVINYYKTIIDNAKTVLENNVDIFYCPVETLGCVDLKKPKWVKDDNGFYSFSADFRVNSTNPKMNPKYADDILKIIVDTLCRNDEKEKTKNLKDNNDKVTDAKTNKNEVEQLKQRVIKQISDCEKNIKDMGIIDKIIEFFTHSKQNALEEAENRAGNIEIEEEKNNKEYYEALEKRNEAQILLSEIVEILDFIKHQKYEKSCKI